MISGIVSASQRCVRVNREPTVVHLSQRLAAHDTLPDIIAGMLHIENLGKRYGDHLVFRGLTHHFSPGCHALCEEDGTGKTTLLNIIAGVIAPDEGDVRIDGHSIVKAPQQAKTRLAYVPENCLAFPQLTGRELLQQRATEMGVVLDNDVLDLAADLGLEPHLDKRFEQMSTGTRRKVYLTAAVLGDPAVIIADGPSGGLDRAARDVLTELFIYWSRDRVVLFASYDHDLVQACQARPFNLAGYRS